MQQGHKKEFLSRNYTNVLRGLCMIAIVWSHTANEFPDILETYHMTPLLNIGMLATGIFLFLSGYGLTLSIKRNCVDIKYVGRHIKKLLLPYLIFWLFYVLIGFLLGFPSHQSDMPADFLSLKMPNVDTWFLRTIFVLYLVYFLFAGFFKSHAGIATATICTLYVLLLAYNKVPPYWWNTIMCFPCGILYAGEQRLQRKLSALHILLIGLLFLSLFIFLPNTFFSAVLCPITFCIVCAQASHRLSVPAKVPILTYIGTNSLYMYLMEEIPIDYMNSSRVGYIVFVFGGIVITIALCYMGKMPENYLTSTLSGRKRNNSSKEHAINVH